MSAFSGTPSDAERTITGASAFNPQPGSGPQSPYGAQPASGPSYGAQPTSGPQPVSGGQPFDSRTTDPQSAASHSDHSDHSDADDQPFPGTQPWEVEDDDGAPYDWFADPQGPPRPMRGRLSRNRPASQPGATASQPSPDGPAPSAQQLASGRPPASTPAAGTPTTAARPAATPEPDPEVTASQWSPAAGPWPAPVPEEPATWAADPVVPGAPSWEPPPAFTAAAAGMQVWPAPVADPPAMPPWPAATGEIAVEPDADDQTAYTSPWNAPSPGSPSSGFSSAGRAAPAPAAASDFSDPPDDAPTSPGGLIPPAVGEQFSKRSDDLKRSVYGGPTSKGPTIGGAADAKEPPEDPASQTDPNMTVPRPFDARGAATRPFGSKDAPVTDPEIPHPAEPGDVPVWPPTPHGDAGHPAPPEQEGKLPDLPFEVWGQKPAPAATASPERSTPPGGLPTPYAQGGAFKQPPFPQAAPARPGKPGGKKALFITLGVLALAGVATGGFYAYKSVSSPSKSTATTAATRSEAPATITPDTSSTPVVPASSLLNSEETDPRKLSLSEAFPQKKFDAAGVSFNRVKTDMTNKCEDASSGAFAEALRQQKCSRIVRATYVDSKRRYAVTTGIAVLPTKDNAMEADKAKNLGRNIWFRGLPSANGSGGERVEIAGGYAAGLVWGRYIVFSYATYADGHTPSTKEKTLGKFSSAFRDQTSLVLERRLANG
ncbi:hypothetical protein [Nonomuraea rhizosphaerae]|uniref:hypothetical protein n=1 Tax=Nonomuraea rhizosphaerae TaxID=2665663 RepID=UPI001C5FEB6B|nr:hypothetical protein [Nonomuraea rhizosphaerae]